MGTEVKSCFDSNAGSKVMYRHAGMPACTFGDCREVFGYMTASNNVLPSSVNSRTPVCFFLLKLKLSRYPLSR